MKKLALVGAMVFLVLFAASANGIRFGIGLGGIPQGSTFRCEAIQAFGRFPLGDVLHLDLSVLYLPPLLPAERPVAAWITEIGAGFGAGAVALKFGAGAGLLWVDGLMLNVAPVCGVSAGLELALGKAWGAYAQARFIVALRDDSFGAYIYFYRPWTVGLIYRLGPTGEGPSP